LEGVEEVMVVVCVAQHAVLLCLVV
jgi:hypothetical protein